MARTRFGVTAFIFLLSLPAYAQTGHVAPGVGAINQSMAGAGTAMPLDATGALFWNPASITALKSSEVDVNVDLFLIHAELSSSLEPNALGSGLPPRTLSGSSKTDVKRAVVASLAWVHKPKEKKSRYGLLIAEIGGFGFSYKNNGTNPVTTPQPPNGFGVGDIRTDYKLIQLAPSFAYQLNDHLSVGISPDLDFSSLRVIPFPFTPPDDANRDGFRTFPSSNRPWAVGGGVQGGIYYENQGWQLGTSIKSPQWFESFEFDGRDELGRPRRFEFTLNYPLIATMGIGWSKLEHFKAAADVRYIDYRNTEGFGKSGFNTGTGAVQGLGWKSIWVFATGIQFQPSDRYSVRWGYGLNQSPIRDKDTFFNLGSALITRQQVNAGFSYQLKDHLTASFNYHHGFENDVQGRYQTVLGPIPGSSVQSKFGTDVVVFSLNSK